MKGKIRNFYAGGNTAKGFYSLYDSALQDLDRIFILKGGPGTGKSTIMREIGAKMCEKGLDIEYLHCSSDTNSIDGVIIRSIKAGIVDGTAPHVIEPKAPGAVEEYVNLGYAWDSKKLAAERDRIRELAAKKENEYRKAYEAFADALKIHDEWEKIYIANMDFKAADELTKELINLFFGSAKLNKKSYVRHSFLGAATPAGPVDFIQNLTEETANRYFIKGRPGSGKSTMLKKIAAAAEDRGFDAEIYHCGFDPRSLDMVILPEAGIAIFDSTAPHEHFPDRENDEIVDMYARCIKPGTDEEHASGIEAVGKKYKAKMKEGTARLANAKKYHTELEKYYVDAVDFSKVDRIKERVLKELEERIK